MTNDKIAVAILFLNCLKENGGTANSDQIYDVIENAGLDPYDDLVHVRNLLQQQDIVDNRDDGNYRWDLTDFGYQVIKQGYENWLNEREKISNVTKKTVFATLKEKYLNGVFNVLAITISIFSIILSYQTSNRIDSISGAEKEVSKSDDKNKKGSVSDNDVQSNELIDSLGRSAE